MNTMIVSPRYTSLNIYMGLHRCLQTTASNQKHNTSLSRQSKVFQKLLGHRESGSKKRWYPSEQSNTPRTQITSIRDIGKVQNKQGKSATRRISVLNKLFMKHITDQLATGSVAEQIVGQGLEISRVKITPDFNGINVYWVAKGETCSDTEIERTLHRCSGILRHELSQLRLMGEVPRIYFVKDKFYANVAEVQNILKDCDIGEDEYEEINVESLHVQEELGLNRTVGNDLPTMRHDVFGLDHKEIMTGILAKLKKSKDAWDAHVAGEKSSLNIENCVSTPTPRLDALKEKMEESRLNEERLRQFLNKRGYKPSIADRKQPIVLNEESDYGIYEEYYGIEYKEDRDFIEEDQH